MATQQQPSSTALWRRPLVCGEIGKSRSALYRDISKGLFTLPVNIGGERVAWPGYEVEAIKNARIAGADDDAIKALVSDLHEKRKSTPAI